MSDLEKTLVKLRELQALTDRLSRDPDPGQPHKARQYHEELLALMRDIETAGAPSGPKTPRDSALREEIARLLVYLRDATSDLLAIIQTQHKIAGKEIASLKTKKDLLRSYPDSRKPKGTLIDSDA